MGLRLRGAKEVHREWPFNAKLPAENALTPEEAERFGGGDLLVQGTIDCCFVEDGAWVLLDYKTNRVDPEKPFEDEAARIAEMYREQQAIYAEALEKATGLAVAEKWLYLSAAGKAIRL